MKLLRTLLFVFFCFMLVPAAKSLACVVSYSPEGTLSQTSSSNSAGQSFTATCSGTITTLTVTVGTDPSSNGILRFYSGGTGNTGAVIATAATGLDLSSGEHTYTLTTPVAVARGVQYSWVITTAETSDDSFLFVSSTDGGGTYDGGNYLRYGYESKTGWDVKFSLNIEESGGGEAVVSIPFMGLTGCLLFACGLLGSGFYVLRRKK